MAIIPYGFMSHFHKYEVFLYTVGHLRIFIQYILNYTCIFADKNGIRLTDNLENKKKTPPKQERVKTPPKQKAPVRGAPGRNQ